MSSKCPYLLTFTKWYVPNISLERFSEDPVPLLIPKAFDGQLMINDKRCIWKLQGQDATAIVH